MLSSLECRASGGLLYIRAQQSGAFWGMGSVTGQEGSQDLHKNFTKGQMWVRLSLTGIRGHLLCPLWTSCLLFDLTWTSHAVSQASVIFSPANGQYLLQAVMNEHCWKWLENCIGTLGAWSVGELHHYIQPPPLLCLRPTLLGNVTYISGFVSSGPDSFISFLEPFQSCTWPHLFPVLDRGDAV